MPADESGGSPVRVQRLRLRSHSRRRRRLTVTFYVEWTLGPDREQTQAHVVSSWDARSQALFARNPFSLQDGGRIAFAATSSALTSFTADRTMFLGRNGSMARPAAMGRKNLSRRAGAAMDPCAAMQVVVELNPGQSAEVICLLGQCESGDRAGDLIRRFRGGGRVEDALLSTGAFWDRTLGALRVSTPEQSVDFLLNRWLLYQTLACRLWGRSAFYQSGGAFGFRDQLQDALALLYARPELTREQILRAAARQFVQGDVQHWWHPRTGAGVRTRCGDDLLWLPYAACQYVRVTGDTGILDHPIRFLEDRELEPDEHEAYLTPATSSEEASLFEHCRRAIERGLTSGPHGLPLIGSGDWNDGLNRVGTGGKGESVWLAWFLVAVLNDFAELCRARGADELADRCARQARQLADNVEQHAWDGRWYRRGYYDDGSPLGSDACDEMKIDSLPQSWAAISGAADPRRVELAIESVWQRLVRVDEPGGGLALLFTPPFDTSAQEPGYVKGYPPGIRENGGQYTHAALWLAMALARRGDGDRAVELLRLLNPIERARQPEQVQRYRVEPYVVAADIYSAPGLEGLGGWTWYTGSAGWMYRVWIEEVPGFRLRGRRLRIDPVIPADWGEFRIEYVRGQTVYDIQVANPDGVRRGVVEAVLDGERMDEAELPLAEDGKRHVVQVRMGHAGAKSASPASPSARPASRHPGPAGSARPDGKRPPVPARDET